ncbi:hypothetical protein V6N12_024778 [Hibiscus sabdariffa]|uniref:Uncharacterized protein n=1 Tax=Hibiscus sabdariffa TaxID=183260 RepID=A0ABR2B9E9_9ROSI
MCSKEDEEAEEWYKGNFSYIAEMEKDGNDGRFLGEEDLAGSAQQVLMSEQNCGQNGNFSIDKANAHLPTQSYQNLGETQGFHSLGDLDAFT